MNLSIIIPTHSRGKQVLTAVKSIFQTCPVDIEVIVVEDRTTEGKMALEEHIKQGLIKYVSNDTGPFGAAGTRNLGVSHASHRYVLFLDDDDQILPGYIERLLDYLSNPTANWGFCDQIRKSDEKKARANSSMILSNAPFKNKIAATSAGFWVQKDLFQKVGGFDHKQTVDEDTDLCCRLLAIGENPYYMKFPGIKLNRDDNIDRLTSSTKTRMIAECYKRTFDKNIYKLTHNVQALEYLSDRTPRMICKAYDTELLQELRTSKFSLKLRIIWFLREAKYFRRILN